MAYISIIVYHNIFYAGVISVVWPLRSVASKYDVYLDCASSFRIIAFLQDLVSRFFSSFRCVASGKPINFLFWYLRLALSLSLGICTLLWCRRFTLSHSYRIVYCFCIFVSQYRFRLRFVCCCRLCIGCAYAFCSFAICYRFLVGLARLFGIFVSHARDVPEEKANSVSLFV